MESTGFIDILILAMIAAFLVFRLRSALGRRTGHQRRPDSVPREVEKSGDTVIHLPDREATGRAPQDADDGPPPLDPADAEAMADSEAGTVQLKAADPDFDEAQFLDGARIAFEMILDAYAGGDKEALRALLADDVLARFAREIDRRSDNDETLETTLVSFASVSVEDTRVEKGRAAEDGRVRDRADQRRARQRRRNRRRRRTQGREDRRHLDVRARPPFARPQLAARRNAQRRVTVPARRLAAAALALTLAACGDDEPSGGTVAWTPTGFSDLPGWTDDRHGRSGGGAAEVVRRSHEPARRAFARRGRPRRHGRRLAADLRGAGRARRGRCARVLRALVRAVPRRLGRSFHGLLRTDACRLRRALGDLRDAASRPAGRSGLGQPRRVSRGPGRRAHRRTDRGRTAPPLRVAAPDRRRRPRRPRSGNRLGRRPGGRFLSPHPGLGPPCTGRRLDRAGGLRRPERPSLHGDRPRACRRRRTGARGGLDAVDPRVARGEPGRGPARHEHQRVVCVLSPPRGRRSDRQPRESR